MKLLCISGVAGSGKDTFANFLARLGGINVALADPLKRVLKDIYGFSDTQLWGPSAERNKPDPRYPRRHTLSNKSGSFPTCSCCGFVWSNRMENPDNNPCHLTPRYALQLLGTDWGRHCYPYTWPMKTLAVARELLADPKARYSPSGGVYLTKVPETAEDHRADFVTVSDMRFENEIQTFREAGATLVRIRRPGAGLGGAAGRHASEAEQEEIPDSAFDGVIDNSGTLEDLAKIAYRFATAFTE